MKSIHFLSMFITMFITLFNFKSMESPASYSIFCGNYFLIKYIITKIKSQQKKRDSLKSLFVKLYAHRKPNKVNDEIERKLKKLIVNLIVQALGLLVSVS